MNNTDRKSLTSINDQLEEIKGQLEGLLSELETLKDDEQTKFDNLEEGAYHQAKWGRQ